MFVDETLLSEVKDVIGKHDTKLAFRRISDAVRLLNNKYKGNDWNTGVMEICAYNGYVTMPADVANVLGVLVGGSPTIIRDSWFQFHVNGPGDQLVQWGYTDDYGPVATFRDPSGPVQLVAIVENALDQNCSVRVYGYDESGKRIYTPGAGGILEDGFLVPTIFGFPAINPAAQAITRIERVQKDVTNGYIRLVAVDATGLCPHTQIGYYAPWETVPSYRRVRVPNCSSIKIKYRRRDVDVRGLGDWINLDNRLALFMALKAIQFRLADKPDLAETYEAKAAQTLSDEADSNRPPGLNTPQIIYPDYPDQGGEQLMY